MTVGQAIEAYREYKLTVKANKPVSVTTTLYRLRSFFSEPGLAIYQLTPQRCNGYYQKLVGKQKPEDGGSRPRSLPTRATRAQSPP